MYLGDCQGEKHCAENLIKKDEMVVKLAFAYKIDLYRALPEFSLCIYPALLAGSMPLSAVDFSVSVFIIFLNEDFYSQNGSGPTCYC